MGSGRRVRNRMKKKESAAQVIASNDDLLTELLRRFPVKSLLKFECVCKHWLSLITDPHFTRRIHLKSNAVSALFLDCYPEIGTERICEIVPLDPSPTPVELENLDFAGDPHGIKIEQSCNGLLLLHSFEEKKDMQVYKYLVYNPTTKQSKTLPPLPPPPLHAGAEMMVQRPVLAFDPSESHSYKVVCILRSRSRPASDYVIQILIYSSETGSWRVSGAPFNPPVCLGFWNGVYCNGAIHWLGDADASLYFHLNEELVREMPMPPPLDGCRSWPRYFGESGGRLYLSDSYEHLTTHLNLYEMERDRSGWFLKFRVDPGMLPRFTMPAECIHEISLLYVGRGEKEEDSFMVLYMPNDGEGIIIQYNFLTQTHREICEFGLEINSPWSVHASSPAYAYIESFSLV